MGSPPRCRPVTTTQGVLFDLHGDLGFRTRSPPPHRTGLDRIPVVEHQPGRGWAPPDLARQTTLHVPALYRQLRDREEEDSMGSSRSAANNLLDAS